MLFTLIHQTIHLSSLALMHSRWVQYGQIVLDVLLSCGCFKGTALLASSNLAESKASKSASNLLADLKSVEFSYEELAEATNDFSLSCKIGQGGFASVYYGLIRNQVSICSILIEKGVSVYLCLMGFVDEMSCSPLQHV